MKRTTETVTVSRTDQLMNPASRRDFLRLMGIGGAIVFLPSALISCDDGGLPVQTPGSGGTVTIDFAKGDIAVLQFAFALEQLEADFYSRVASNFGASGLSAAEQTIFADIRNHEVIHREALRTVLGSANTFTIEPVYNDVSFGSRTSILATAKAFEDLGVAAYNGAAQYLTSVNNLL
ncbi:MAG TPA: ferritin-like domain-containing protein, partial [Gemmatimonadaceae bacterium]|nr:ferritin-like domain-containing protein [Gemmatimonadaceae bacterium]